MFRFFSAHSASLRLASFPRPAFMPTRSGWRLSVLCDMSSLPLEAAMEKVLGIGGLFFRARDPDISRPPGTPRISASPPSHQLRRPSLAPQAGPTAFAPLPRQHALFSATPNRRKPLQWMVNFRVANLEAILAQLRSAGIEVTLDPTTYPTAVSPASHDPEGQPHRTFWQPAGHDT